MKKEFLILIYEKEKLLNSILDYQISNYNNSKPHCVNNSEDLFLDISKKNLKTNVSKYKRKIDLRGYKANIADTKKILKWKPKLTFKTIIHKMINNELF